MPTKDDSNRHSDEREDLNQSKSEQSWANSTSNRSTPLSRNSSPTLGHESRSEHSGETLFVDETDMFEEQHLVLFSVYCLHPFDSDDATHLSFRQSEVLDVIVQEPSGWWAAHRRNEKDVVGWIPAAFVQPIAPTAATLLIDIPEKLREIEFNQLYSLLSSVPHQDLDHDSDIDEPRENLKQNPRLKDSELDDVYEPEKQGKNSSSMLRQHSNPSRPLEVITPPPPLSSMPSDVTITPPMSPKSARRKTVDTVSRLFKRDTKTKSIEAINVSAEVEPLPIDIDQIVKNAANLQIMSDGKSSRSTLPWFMRPRFPEDSIIRDSASGILQAGSLPALVETLTSLTTNTPQDIVFRDAFLSTFRTFMTPQALLDNLISKYVNDPAKNMSEQDYTLWTEVYMIPQRAWILSLFTRWVTAHGMVEEEPEIVQPLKLFLSEQMRTKQLEAPMKQLLKALQAQATSHSIPMARPPKKPIPAKVLKVAINKLDSDLLAEQLCIYEHRLYSKIRRQECINWGRTQTGHSVINLNSFCSSHERIATWVQKSILSVESIRQRAQIVDFWIKVAEKSKMLHNFSSLSAIVTALSSTVISRLLLTWSTADLRLKNHLPSLVELNDAQGNFANYRQAIKSVETPCVPFIVMYLSDIIRIQSQSDTVKSPQGNQKLVSFSKRLRFYETMTMMLRWQTKPYTIAAHEPYLAHIESQLHDIYDVDEGWLWTRSEEIQRVELRRCDYAKHLTQTGF